MTATAQWIEDMIKKHEGYRETIYLDTRGYLTGGYGHAFHVGSILPKEIWDSIFKCDLEYAERVVAGLGIPDGVLDEVRRGVLVDMAYNLGWKLAAFKKTIEAIKRKSWEEAADEMLKSAWAGQVKKRAVELAEMMRTGRKV